MLQGVLPYDTSGFSAGAKLYLSQSSAGALTSTPPSTPATGWAQLVAIALDSSASGHIFVDRKGVLIFAISRNTFNIGNGSGAEVDFFPDSTHHLTLIPATLTVNRTLTLPDATDTLAGQSPANGGTGQTSYAAKGDLLASSGPTALSKLAVGADYKVLRADSSQATGLAYDNAAIRLFSQTNDVTVNTTNAETTILGTGVGSLTLPANLFVVGRTLKFTIRGTASRASGTQQYKIKLGGITIFDSAAQTVANAGHAVIIEGIITCRSVGATGTVIGQGTVKTFNAAAVAIDIELRDTGVVTIDTTGTLVFDATITWSTSSLSNTITINNCLLEII
jgi:hypothetical protein